MFHEIYERKDGEGEVVGLIRDDLVNPIVKAFHSHDIDLGGRSFIIYPSNKIPLDSPTEKFVTDFLNELRSKTLTADQAKRLGEIALTRVREHP